ncbi:hypothetical protein BV25DRAFT_1106393 [Artomyces pyxidatus]|uniref:Uncharacterized protein n=1 Tax=Artomyces pyxidatus TaxID=48021 RepID=A0ACB8TGE7_9AGAM|nr:hypothetical protein BV25DRAFT_1106393 [Artomyces pyxidatus]
MCHSFHAAKTVSFEEIPTDIHLLIFQHLSVPDVLSLKQTCRALHVLGSSDYLWHQIARAFSIPLDIPFAADTTLIPAHELQRSIVNASRLEHNWRQPAPLIKRCAAVVYGTSSAAIDEMQLLPGARWLFTAQRKRRRTGPHMTIVNVWTLPQDGKAAYHAGSVDIAGQYKQFSVAFNSTGDAATLAISTYAAEQSDQSVLRIYDVPLLDRSKADFREHRLMKAFSKPADAMGIIHELTVDEDMVAAIFVNFDVDFPGHSYQIFVVNTTTWAQKVIHPKFSEPLNRLSLKLSSGKITLVGATTDAIVVRVLHLPGCVTGKYSDRPLERHPSLERVELAEGLGYLAALTISSGHNPIDSDTLIFHTANIPVSISLLFFDLLDTTSGHAHLVRLVSTADDVSGSRHRCQDKQFPFPVDTSVKLVRIGRTGRRAVWIEQNWDKDELRIMRSHFPEEDIGASNVGVLLPNDPAFPFTPRMCQSMAFDEAAGRLCLGLFNGDIWVLHFN